MADGLTVTLRQDRPIPLDLSFAVKPGEVTALIGLSGAGKTTVLRAIAGLYRPEHGQIACAGETWLDRAQGIEVAAHQRRCGFVFQSYALFPHRTALGNVMEAMLGRPAPHRRAAALALLDRTGIAALADRPIHTLSGGQQQRVALARALARQPAVLLLDEPFSAVDRPARRALGDLIGDLRREPGIPVLLVTHDIADAARLADRIVLIDHGRVVQQGPAQDVIARPAGDLARALVGD